MGNSMTAVYLILGLALVGGLYYALTQITARQRRLNAELTRLERLAAEVSMNAEAILERVDERIDRLNELSVEVEGRMAALQTAMAAPGPTATPVAAEPSPAQEAKAEPIPAQKPRKPRKKQPAPAAQAPEPEAPAVGAEAEVPAAEQPAEQTAPPDRYQALRTRVSALADQGKDAGEIAKELGIPRGEVQLILNLRGRKVTA